MIDNAPVGIPPKHLVARIGKKISKFRQQHNRQTRQVLQQEHYCGSVTKVDNNGF